MVHPGPILDETNFDVHVECMAASLVGAVLGVVLVAASGAANHAAAAQMRAINRELMEEARCGRPEVGRREACPGCP